MKIESNNSARIFMLLIFLAAAISVALWLANQSMMHSGPHSKVQRDLNDIQSAVNSYRTEFDQEPPVPPSSFFDALRGSNARGLRFLSDDGFVYKSGIRCDRWGNPYQVFRGTDGWLVRTPVVARMEVKLAGAALLAGIEVPAHNRGSTMGDGPDGTPLRLSQRGSFAQEVGQKAAQHLDDRGAAATTQLSS